MARARRPIYGTLNLMILQTLSKGPLHGLGVIRRIHDRSRGEITVEEGALYPALRRLAERGLVQATWGVTDHNRRGRFYELTRTGRDALEEERSSYVRQTRAVLRVVELFWV